MPTDGRRFSETMSKSFSQQELDAIEKFESSQDKYKLTEGQYTELQNAFELFDKDKSGCISITELQSVMATLGHPQTGDEMAQIMA